MAAAMPHPVRKASGFPTRLTLLRRGSASLGSLSITESQRLSARDAAEPPPSKATLINSSHNWNDTRRTQVPGKHSIRHNRLIKHCHYMREIKVDNKAFWTQAPRVHFR